MNHELTIEMDAIEGAMIRVLGTIERRGFELLAVSSERQGNAMQLKVEVDGGERSIEVLARQLQRVIDIRTLSFQPKLRAFQLPIKEHFPRFNRRGLSAMGIPSFGPSAEQAHANAVWGGTQVAP
jgi:acetolactate synthase regulatory subunit